METQKQGRLKLWNALNPKPVKLKSINSGPPVHITNPSPPLFVKWTACNFFHDYFKTKCFDIKTKTETHFQCPELTNKLLKLGGKPLKQRVLTQLSVKKLYRHKKNVKQKKYEKKWTAPKFREPSPPPKLAAGPLFIPFFKTFPNYFVIFQLGSGKLLSHLWFFLSPKKQVYDIFLPDFSSFLWFFIIFYFIFFFF